MKAKIELGGGKTAVLTLTPETTEETKSLGALVANEPHTIHFRGFKYMDAGIEFYIGPYVSEP